MLTLYNVHINHAAYKIEAVKITSISHSLATSSHRHPSARGNVARDDDNGVYDSDVSMVLEKAQVLLCPADFSDFSLLLDEYRTRAIGVEQLAEDLVRLLDGGKKVIMFQGI